MTKYRVVRVDEEGIPFYYRVDYKCGWFLPWNTAIVIEDEQEAIAIVKDLNGPAIKRKPIERVIYPVPDIYY